MYRVKERKRRDGVEEENKIITFCFTKKQYYVLTSQEKEEKSVKMHNGREFGHMSYQS